MKLLDILCDPARTSVDVGAKLGMYTYRLLRRSRDVIAFEPVPLLVHLLERTFVGRRCRIEPCALSDRPGRTMMRIPYGSDGDVKFGRSTVEPHNELAHDDVARVEEIDVELKTVDQHGSSQVGFIKIDVEGHEVAVIRGARETLARERPNLLIEANDHHHPGAVSELRALLTSLDYRGYFRGEHGLVDLESIAEAGYFQQMSIENFIFVHGTRQEVTERLRERLERRR